MRLRLAVRIIASLRKQQKFRHDKQTLAGVLCCFKAKRDVRCETSAHARPCVIVKSTENIARMLSSEQHARACALAECKDLRARDNAQARHRLFRHATGAALC